jgi:flagellar basal body rod protein FlgB
MTQAFQRQGVAAGNIANLETPGYRTREGRFDDPFEDHLAAAGRQRPLGQFTRAQTVLAAKFRLVSYAINEWPLPSARPRPEQRDDP